MSGINLNYIDHVALTVTDPEKSVAWYEQVLGMEQCFMHGLEGPPFLLR
ncbi:VOC family protein, partial [Tritonibacter sp. SIMBA_163]